MRASTVPAKPAAGVIGSVILRRRAKARRTHERSREDRRSPAFAAIACLGYFATGLGTILMDPLYLTSAWLFAGALAVSLKIARDASESLFNPYTFLFGTGVVVFLSWFVLDRCGIA